MIVVGLTGGIASGKSTVAKMLLEKGAAVIDADQLAREVVMPGKPAWREIKEWLGGDILLEDGNINRKKVAQIVFKDDRARRKLNSIIHPRIAAEFSRKMEELKEKSTDVLIYDIPLLIEGGMQRKVDVVLLVSVPRQVQEQRLRERDRLTNEEVLARLSSQMPLRDKEKYADFIIDNSGTLEETARQADHFWLKLSRGGFC